MPSTRGAYGIRAERPIAGWLILPALGTIFSPLLSAYTFAQTIPALNNIMATNRDDLKTWIFAEALLNGTLVIGWCRALYLLWKRDERFPTNFTALCLIASVGLWADAALAMHYAPSMDIAEAIKDAIRTTVYSAIWVPYMLFSKRVKHTFGLGFYPEFGPTTAQERETKKPATQERVATAESITPPEIVSMRRKANRMGLFVTLVALVSVVLGFVFLLGEIDVLGRFFVVVGMLGVLFGYILVRVWYWVRLA